MTALGREIRDLVATDGPISVERFMQLCLQHPRFGYYMSRDGIGRDFTTAPEISQMFGELVGLWAAQVWIDAGAPRPFRFVELGPGRGTLTADALRAAAVVPGFHDALRVDLVETSPRLANVQRDRLAGLGVPVAWVGAVEDVPPGPAVVVANEFFDALPVRHYVRGRTGWHERLVGLDEAGDLAFGLAPERMDIAGPEGLPGQVLEVGHRAGAIAAALSTRVARDGGALLVCDYGHGASGFGETLQAMRAGAYVGVLDEPGEADLTVHVDFAALGRAAVAAGAAVHGPVPQGAFLRALGIAERARTLRRGADARQSDAIAAALDRLAGPASDMATLFKVLAVTPRGGAVPPGFEDGVRA